MTADIRNERHTPWWLKHLDALVKGLLAALVLAVVAIGVCDRLTAGWQRTDPEVTALAAAATPQDFEAIVIRNSKADETSRLPAPENLQIWPLRTQMFIDSLVLEPAYGGLLLLTLLALRRRTRGPAAAGWDWPLQGACLLLACGVMCDLAENGMVIRAAEDGLHCLLAQGTVDDVHLATQLKWGFLGAALASTGLLARRVPSFASTRALRIGSWAAIAVAPLAAVQCVRISFGADVDQVLQAALGLAFLIALVAFGVALRHAGGDRPHGADVPDD